MKTLFACLLFVACATFCFGNTIKYYSNSPDSVVNPGETYLGDQFQGVVMTSQNEPITHLGFGFTLWEPAKHRFTSIEFGIPLFLQTVTIIDQTFLFEGLDPLERRNDFPSITVFSSTFDDENNSVVLSQEAPLVSGTFTIHELVFEDTRIMSCAVTGALSQGPTVDSPVTSYVALLYNSDYVIDRFPVAIPEPSTYAAMLGTLVLGAAFTARRKRS